jgi:hypothetical protein
MHIRISLLLALFPLSGLLGQGAFFPLSRGMEQTIDPILHSPGNGVHTSFKPLLNRDVLSAAEGHLDSSSLAQQGTGIDSLLLSSFPVPKSRFDSRWAGRHLRFSHLVQLNSDDLYLIADPVFEFTTGRDGDRQVYTNTRGLRLAGSIGKRFGFDASFYENQSVFPFYLDSAVDQRYIVPGQGRVKNLGEGKFDYAFSTGTIHYQLNRHFTFAFGQDRNFIGDGYRSLLLSDNSFHYPFVKIVTDVWKVRYVNLFAELRDISRGITDDSPFLKKYASMHYLDLEVGKRLNVGIFEAVIWHADTVGGARGFDLGYMNPFIFFRPVEFSIGSPDNVLMGLNLRYRITEKHVLYGQVMLDEFLLSNVRAGNGWWANKQGIQAGYKGFSLFGIPNLNVQAELNYVRPYTYQHREKLGTYTHYRAPLAHPLGANFTEGIGFVQYRFGRWQADARLSIAEVGLDTAGLNLGQDVFQAYNSYVNEYGNRTGQGLKTRVVWGEFNASYVVNPLYRFTVFAGISSRNESNTQGKRSMLLVQGGLRTNLFNRYYDF